jgi:hypothetical protein
MAKPLLTDDLWAVIEPLLPKRPPRPTGGRPIVDDRDRANGLLRLKERTRACHAAGVNYLGHFRLLQIDFCHDCSSFWVS